MVLMRYNGKGYSSKCEVGAQLCGGCRIPNLTWFTPGRFPLFSICMIKSSRVSTVNEGFWQEIKGTQSRKQQRRKAAKLLQTTGLEAEGIFIHPANIDFCLCCSFHQCFKLNPSPQPLLPPLCAPLWHRAGCVLGGFIKVAHQSHDVVHLLLTTISSGFLRSTVPSHHFKQVFLSKSDSEAEGDCLALGCTNHPECCTLYCIWLLCVKDMWSQFKTTCAKLNILPSECGPPLAEVLGWVLLSTFNRPE